ncbi:helix-turn-helix domain-containing protein [Azospirillum soli]|uniref:helix-turn-helix domain-containing protein n=1 Tax=Azospirillum soli TaxID=1304799 RepID=UPI001AE3EF7D|nr:helix-turn-helix domain-containing protein [Azospirillum soli]MBP2315492.1 hypothetical protein [Azospirillum soli]
MNAAEIFNEFGEGVNAENARHEETHVGRVLTDDELRLPRVLVYEGMPKGQTYEETLKVAKMAAAVSVSDKACIYYERLLAQATTRFNLATGEKYHCKTDWIERGLGPAVYASGATLERKAGKNGQKISARYRQILEQELAIAGFIWRVDAANLSREGERDENGRLVSFSGISLIPTILRFEEFKERITRHDAEVKAVETAKKRLRALTSKTRLRLRNAAARVPHAANWSVIRAHAGEVFAEAERIVDRVNPSVSDLNAVAAALESIDDEILAAIAGAIRTPAAPTVEPKENAVAVVTEPAKVVPFTPRRKEKAIEAEAAARDIDPADVLSGKADLRAKEARACEEITASLLAAAYPALQDALRATGMDWDRVQDWEDLIPALRALLDGFKAGNAFDGFLGTDDALRRLSVAVCAATAEGIDSPAKYIRSMLVRMNNGGFGWVGQKKKIEELAGPALRQRHDTMSRKPSSTARQMVAKKLSGAIPGMHGDSKPSEAALKRALEKIREVCQTGQ